MLTTVQTLLLDCLKTSSELITTDRLRPLKSKDWANFLNLASEQRIRPLLYHQMKQRELVRLFPENVVQDLRSAYKNTTTRNLILLRELHNISKAFQESGIAVIVLKGMHLLNQVYGNISLREMTDIDLLVNLESLGRSAHILENLGFEARYPYSISSEVATTKHLPAYIKQGIGSIELHWALTDPDQEFFIDTTGLWERSIPAKIPGTQALVLSIEDLLLHLCLHTSYVHQFSFGLRPSCDITQLFSVFSNALDWEQLIARAKQWNIQRGVYLALKIAKDLIGAEIHNESLETLKPASINDAILQTAITQIFTEKTFTNSINLFGAKIVAEPNRWIKLRLILGYIFMSKASIAERYALPPETPKLYRVHLVHMIDVLRDNAGKVWQLLFKNSQLAQLGNRKINLANWLSAKD